MISEHFQFIEKKLKAGVSWKDVTKEFNTQYKLGLTPEALRKRYQREIVKLDTLDNDLVERAFRLVKQSPQKPTDLARRFNLDMDGLEDLLDDLLNNRVAIKFHQGYLVFDKSVPTPDNITHYIDFYTEEEWVKWGVIADPHLCSVYEQIDLLHKFYKICEEEKVRGVICAGDFTAGNGTVYKGQFQDLKIIGEDKQINYVCSVFPETSLKTYTVRGNHDNDLYKQCGSDIVQKIADKREDIVNLGNMRAILEQDGIKFHIIHGEGGLGQVRSQKPQKIIDAMKPEEICNITVIGHYHVNLHIPTYRNSTIILPGCFESQSDYLLKRGLSPDVGGCILELKVARISDKIKTVRHKIDYVDFNDFV